MPQINLAKIGPLEFGPLPIAKYACILAVNDLQRDAEGNPLLNGDNQPAKRHTNAGDDSWNVTATILDGPQIGRVIFDNFSFGEKAIKRIAIVFVRGGLMQDGEMRNVEADELDGTCWWVDVDRHEARQNKDGTAKTDKQGKPLLSARVAFAGYELMNAADAKRLKASFKVWKEKKEAAASEPETLDAPHDDDVPF